MSLLLKENVERFTKQHIKNTYEFADYNIEITVRLLGISRQHLYRLIKKYNIQKGTPNKTEYIESGMTDKM